MTLKQTGVLFLVFYLFVANISIAQRANTDTSCQKNNCTCSQDHSPAGLMVTALHHKHEWMISYRSMFMLSQGLNYTNHNEDINPYVAKPVEMQMQMHMWMMMYGLNKNLSIMAMGQYQNNYMKMTMSMGQTVHQHAMSSVGLGDTKILVIYGIIKNPTLEFSVNTGLQVPTGKTNVKAPFGSMMYSTQRMSYSMQTGSGTLDVMGGANLIYQMENSVMGVQINGLMHPYKNIIGYQLGNELNNQIWISKQWTTFLRNSIRFETVYNGKIKGIDTSLNMYGEPGANANNYGGLRINTYIGVNIQGIHHFLSKCKLSCEYGIPLLQRLNGLQLSNKHIFNFNLSTNF